MAKVKLNLFLYLRDENLLQLSTEGEQIILKDALQLALSLTWIKGEENLLYYYLDADGKPRKCNLIFVYSAFNAQRKIFQIPFAESIKKGIKEEAAERLNVINVQSIFMSLGR